MAKVQTAAELFAVIKRKGKLQALDENVAAICRVSGKSETCAADIAAIVLRDCALTSNILAIANSALYGRTERVTTVSGAVILLGFQKVKSLAMGFAIFHNTARTVKDRELYRLLVCCYFSGLFAMTLAARCKLADPEEAFVVGLLHHLPMVLLANTFPDRYREMERLQMKDDLALADACERVFAVRYEEIAHRVAEMWDVPEKVKLSLLHVANKNDSFVAYVREACMLADVMFGNPKGNRNALDEAEGRIQDLLDVTHFSIDDFIRSSCRSDPNVEVFFGVTLDDIEMIMNVVRWGKISPLQLASGLAFGVDLPSAEDVRDDASLLIGRYETELLTMIRSGANANEVLMLAQEALHECLSPAHVFMAFRNTKQNDMQGRLYAGGRHDIVAADLAIRPADSNELVSQALSSERPVHSDVRNERSLHALPVIKKLAARYTLILPITLDHGAIGFYLIARSEDQPFSSEEQKWAEAITEAVIMMFQQQK